MSSRHGGTVVRPPQSMVEVPVSANAGRVGRDGVLGMCPEAGPSRTACPGVPTPCLSHVRSRPRGGGANSRSQKRLSDSAFRRVYTDEVDMTDSQTCFIEYARSGSESAFRELVVRYIGLALGSTEDTAQKRVSRALEKLHSFLRRRGVSLSVAALGTALAGHAVTAAPAGLAAAISATALANAAAGGGIALTLLKLVTMTKLNIGIIGAIVVAALAVPVVLHYRSVPAAPEQDLAATQPEPTAEVDAQPDKPRLDPSNAARHHGFRP